MLTIASSTASQPVVYPLDLPFDGLAAPTRRAPQYPAGYTREVVPRPPEVPATDPGWNRLDWPVHGASRAAEMNALLTGDDWAALRTQLSAARAVTVAWDDGAGGTGSAKLYVKDVVAVSDSRPGLAGDDTQVLYWLTLADYRFTAASVSYAATAYTETPPATWGDLLADLILQAFGQSLANVAGLNSAVSSFPPPTTYFSTLRLRGRNVVTLADAVAGAIQVRLYVALDGTVSWQTAATASAALVPPVGDLAAGGYRTPNKGRAASLFVTEYDANGIASLGTQVVGGGVTGTLDVWLPYCSSGWAAWAAQYTAWTDVPAPDMTFAGYPGYPASAAVDRFLLDHDAGTCSWLSDGAGYPWPLVGTPFAAVPERPVNFCAILDTHGCWAGLRVTWRKPDGTFTCEDVVACPTCPDEPAPAHCT